MIKQIKAWMKTGWHPSGKIISLWYQDAQTITRGKAARAVGFGRRWFTIFWKQAKVKKNCIFLKGRRKMDAGPRIFSAAKRGRALSEAAIAMIKSGKYNFNKPRAKSGGDVYHQGSDGVSRGQHEQIAAGFEGRPSHSGSGMRKKGTKGRKTIRGRAMRNSDSRTRRRVSQ